MSDDQKPLKTDARGRIRYPAERKKMLLEEFERSGLSGVKFAQMSGVHYATFANWVQKRRKAQAANGAALSAGRPGPGEAMASGAPVRLFEAYVEQGAGAGRKAPTAGLAVELAGGARVLIESPIQLRLAAELLGLLAQSARRAC